MRGFTLIELLAVIVILAIILLISVPIVSNVIKNSKNAALESSAKSIKKAAKDSFMNDQLLGKEIDEVIYVFENGIQRTIPTTASKLEISGEVPKNGYIRVNKETVDLEFNNGEKTIIINKENKSKLNEDVSTVQLPILHKCGTPYTDSRDGKIYNTVKIGPQCWFSQDLAYTANGCLTNPFSGDRACRSAMYLGEPKIYYQYGAYMDGEEKEKAQGLCPEGSYVPTPSDYSFNHFYIASLSPDFGKSLMRSGHFGGTNLSGFDFVLSGGISQSTGNQFQTDVYGLYGLSGLVPLGNVPHVRSLTVQPTITAINIGYVPYTIPTSLKPVRCILK